MEYINQSVYSCIKDKPDNQIWAYAPVSKNNIMLEQNGFFTGISGIGNALLNLVSYDKTKKLFFSLFIILTFNIISFSQTNYNLPVVGSVDTSNVDIKSVYHLFENYLNHFPDSLNYRTNPYWDKEEITRYLDAGTSFFDESAGLMYRKLSAKKHFKAYYPKILSIEPIDSNVFTIQTLYYNDKYGQDSIYGRWIPPYITKHYCIKQGQDYYLKNAISFETKFWNTYNYGFLHYCIHPNLEFDSTAAERALKFIEATCKQYDLPIPENIDYYCTGTREELAKLFNFSYLLSYMDGVTNKFLGRIIFKDAYFDNVHELTHLIFDKPEWKDKSRPFIVNEGLATFIGGKDGKHPFSQDLKEWAKEVREVDTLSLDDVIQNKYRHPFDNDPIYVTGGYIFHLVYQKHKEKGVIKLFNCGKEYVNFQKTIEELFEMPYKDFNVWIMEQLKKE